VTQRIQLNPFKIILYLFSASLRLCAKIFFSRLPNMPNKPALVYALVALKIFRDRPGRSILDCNRLGQLSIQPKASQIG